MEDTEWNVEAETPAEAPETEAPEAPGEAPPAPAAPEATASTGAPQDDGHTGEFLAFARMYPQVKAEDIPADVWEAVRDGTPLTVAYLQGENRRLTGELAALRQSAQNRARSTGSRQSAGAPAKRDPIIEEWLSDE